eukprot:m51a1_g8910 hypothetical protein (276) ;mRNA; r:773661-776226
MQQQRWLLQNNVVGMNCATVEEGVSPDAPFTCREQTCSELLDCAKDKSFLLVRAPPRSGKTGLIDVLVDYIAEAAPDVAASRVDGSSVLRDPYRGKVNAASLLIRDMTDGAVDFTGLALAAKAPTRRLVLVDEAQVLYRCTKDPLWSALKDLLHKRDPSLCVIFFAVHALFATSEYSTTFVPPSCPSLGLVLTIIDRQGELEELITKYNEFARSKRSAEITEQVLSVMKVMSSGNVGLISFLIGRIYSKYCHCAQQPNDEHVTQFLQSAVVPTRA